MTVEPQPAGPTFARSARVNGTCTTYERIYIYIYKKHIYIYIYMTKIFLSCTISVWLALLANYYLYMRAMGRHGFPGIPRRHAAAFSAMVLREASALMRTSSIYLYISGRPAVRRARAVNALRANVHVGPAG